MRNLSDFPVPNEGEITICEINGRMRCSTPENASPGAFTTSTENHPKIHITRDLLHYTGPRDEGKALFLPTDTPFLKQLTQVYSEQGFLEALHTASHDRKFLVSGTAHFLLSLLKYYNKVQAMINPILNYNDEELIEDMSQTRNWVNSSIRGVCWHPHSSRLAVATSDDSVRIYCNDNNYVPLLRCKRQKNITCLAWRPLSLTEIAVGHEGGVIIWNVDFNSLVSRPSVSNTIMLERPGHAPVMSVEWSPRGDILASAAACDSTILIWDVELNKTNQLKGSREHGNILLKWSPAKDKLLSVSNGIVFRIWDCQKWISDRWTVLSGRVQAACWSNCGSHLLFATNTDSIIYGLTVKTDQVFAANLDSSDHAVPLFDLSKMDLEGCVVGGIVQSMETDPRGRHLAVTFKETNGVAVFSVVGVPVLRLVPSSVIVGLSSEVPSSVGFQRNFGKGACLSVGWSSGRLQHFPIIYTDLVNDL